MGRKNRRKGKRYKDKVLFLYGKRKSIRKAVAYCKLHKCYLQPRDIRKKQCNFKYCKWRKEL